MDYDTEIIQTPIGFFKIQSRNGHVSKAHFVTGADVQPYSLDTEFFREATEYFQSKRKKFDCDFTIRGTDFEKKVLNYICKIPYGCTKTYTQVANAIGHPKACRPVANVCARNKIAIFIPCHRVVGTNDMGGYKWGINKKQWLLKMEKDTMAKLQNPIAGSDSDTESENQSESE